jgi:hypothetical protein
MPFTRAASRNWRRAIWRGTKSKFLVSAGILLLVAAMVLAWGWIVYPTRVH